MRTAALGLLENLQRAQLDAFDAARGIREVIRLWNCTQAEAARRLGLSQPALANKLRLLTLTTAQQQPENQVASLGNEGVHQIYQEGQQHQGQSLGAQSRKLHIRNGQHN